MSFGFSLYAMPLLVALVIYFRIEPGNLESGKLPENSEIYHC